MRPLILKCPSCSNDLIAERLACPSCNIDIEGEFIFPALLRLNRSQLDFVEVFIKNRGIIREVERELGVSYPTVRARLDEVIEALGFSADQVPLDRERGNDSDDRGDDSLTRTRRALLDEVRAGKMTPEEALKALGAKAPNRPKEKSDREEPGNE